MNCVIDKMTSPRSLLMIQRAKELQMIAILRVFLIDSMAFDAALGARNLKPDAIDILPGLMPSMLRKVRQMTGLPILTGGLITEKKEVMQALEAGALAISSTAPPHVRPPPKPMQASGLPGVSCPLSASSLRATGMLAALVLPWRSMFL